MITLDRQLVPTGDLSDLMRCDASLIDREVQQLLQRPDVEIWFHDGGDIVIRQLDE